MCLKIQVYNSESHMKIEVQLSNEVEALQILKNYKQFPTLYKYNFAIF